MVKKLNAQNFESEALHAAETVLVDFYADWCGPCKMMAPVVEEIAQEQTDVAVCKVNVDEASVLAAEYRVMSIPTLIVFKSGKETARLVGYRPKAEILAALSK